MEFLRRAQQEEIAPRRGPPKEDHDGRDGEHFWRRLALRALLALSAARLQVVLCEVVEIEPAYSFYHEAPRANGDPRPARHGLAGGYLHAPPADGLEEQQVLREQLRVQALYAQAPGQSQRQVVDGHCVRGALVAP